MLHERLAVELKRLELTAAQAARDSGQPDSQGLRDVLSGRKRLSADLLSALVTGCLVDGVFVLTGRRDAAHAVSDPAEKLLLENYRRCTSEARSNLLQTSALLAAGIAAATSQRSVVQTVLAPVHAGGVAGGNIINKGSGRKKN
nr:transcriptional regulator [Rubrivivax gelatinosus]